MKDQEWLGLEPSVVSGADGIGERLRREAIETDARGFVTDELAGVWPTILRGELVFADSFYTPARWYAALAASASATPVEPASRRLLTRLLLGESQKQTALDCGLCPATLSCALQRTLARIGICAPPCKAPPLLALMARAGVGAETVRARFSTIKQATFEYRIVSVARPELRLDAMLSRAEYDVLCRYVEGSTHAEIARERRRSVRTIANQVAALFRRLDVSGRGELVARLVGDAASMSFSDERLLPASTGARVRLG